MPFSTCTSKAAMNHPHVFSRAESLCFAKIVLMLALLTGGTKVFAQEADLVIVSAKVWTGLPDAATSSPDAIAVTHGRIVAIGSNREIRRRIGNQSTVIDAKGNRVIPGITDSHTHIIGGGLQLARLHLRDVSNKKDFLAAVQRAARQAPEGEWILGGRWSVESWDNPSPPRAAWLDSVTGDRPVFLTRMDGHSAVANSVALAIAGIDADGPSDPAGGEIERDPQTGKPTGILKDSAMELVSRHIPPPSPEAMYRALLRSMKHANSLGITSVDDMCSFAHLAVFRRAEKEHALTVRITAYLTGDFAKHQDEIAKTHYGLNGDMVRLAGLKAYMDGSLGSRNAYMREPYADAPANTPYPRGQLTAFAASTASFQNAITQADRRKLQIAVHAIGDQSNHLLLNAYEEAMRHNKTLDARHRIEHAQHLIPSDIARFAKLGVIASMQPFHKADDGRYAEKALGKRRLIGSYAFRKLVDSGATVVFGSDWPVVTLNPFAGIDSAVNARTLEGKVFLPSHSLTVEEALRAYTVTPPIAIHREHQLGTLEVGKFADIVILKDDVLTIPTENIADVRVDTTIVDGRVVYRAQQ